MDDPVFLLNAVGVDVLGAMSDFCSLCVFLQRDTDTGPKNPIAAMIIFSKGLGFLKLDVLSLHLVI